MPDSANVVEFKARRQESLNDLLATSERIGKIAAISECTTLVQNLLDEGQLSYLGATKLLEGLTNLLQKTKDPS